jgi:large subunit ribosomal protein L30
MHTQLPVTGELNCQKFTTANNMAKVRITQTRSTIKRPETQLRTIQSLGLGKPNSFVEVEYTAQIKGMVQKVSHLVSVTEL